MKIKDTHKRWLLRKVDGVWCKAVSKSEGGYTQTVLNLKETPVKDLTKASDTEDETELTAADLLDYIHDILPDDFVADVRAARKVKGEDGVSIAVFAKNGDATNFGCKGVFGHDLDWSEIYLENVKVHTPLPATASSETEVKP